MDRRILKTRDSIFSAFRKLLIEKPYPKITVQNIIDEANIGRSTFYAHFETKDYLLNALCDEIFSHVFSVDLFKEDSHDFSDAKKGDLNMMSHVLYHLRDDKLILPGILKGEGKILFWQSFEKYFQKLLIDYSMPNRFEDDNIPKDLLLKNLTASFIEIIKWWIGRDMADDPEELISHYQKLNQFFN
ncbi:MAG: TetR/AcrR family transcriptional regulator [Tissierellia bacterium]|nr:TetR/AcrR family transcriptional regulator [Tissierellia bacterium]